MKLIDIAKRLNGELFGAGDIEIKGPAKIDEATEGEITFLANPKYKSYIETTKASAIILDKKAGSIDIPHIKVDNSYMGFLLLLKIFEPKKDDIFAGISPNADVAKSAKIGENPHIGSFVFVGENSTIGDNCTIYPGAIILNNVHIGNNAIIYPGVTIREYCILGNNIILQNGAVIGSDGFGFAPSNNSYIKIPQIGNVIIEDDVEIGANTTIDRATLGSTIIKKGVKLDNLVQIAHNCVIGENTVMAGQVGVAGSTKFGKNVTVGGQTGFNGHITIADYTVIAGRSGVVGDTEEKSVLMGNPAIQIKSRHRIDASLKKLPNAMKVISRLEKQIEQLTNRLDTYEKGNS